VSRTLTLTIAAGLVVAGIVLITGCEDLWLSQDTSLRGTWKAAGIEMVSLDGAVREEPLGDDWTETMTFNEDGTWSFVSVRNGRTTTGNGTYNADHHEITLNGGDTMTYSIDGDTLTFSGTLPRGAYAVYWKKQ
jgi:hypothetical protein